MFELRYFVFFFLIEGFLCYSDRPSIRSRGGHLVFDVAENKDVFITTRGNGRLLVNNEDVMSLVGSVRKSLDNINRGITIDGNNQDIGNYKTTINGLVQRLEILERNTNVTSLTRLNTMLSYTRRRLNVVARKLRTLMLLVSTDECQSNPCANGGTCQDMYNSFMCRCPDAWEGPTCQKDVNECTWFAGTELGCQNGATCVNKPGTYECKCTDGWFGIHCTKRSQDCSSNSEICGHGTCITQSSGVGYKCICDQGWKTNGVAPACTVDVNECEAYKPPCSVSPPVKCINLPGTFFCGPCPAGYSGNGFYCTDVDECAIFNGGCSVNPMVQCINTPGSKICGQCPPGYIGNGVTCSYQGGICGVNNGGCHPQAQCRDNSRISSTYVECICPAGYTGNGIGPNGCTQGPNDPCNPNPCNNGDCKVKPEGGFECNCFRKYTGTLCNIRKDPCDSNPCQNGGTCKTLAFSYYCVCTSTYTGYHCQTEKQGCGLVVGRVGNITYPLPNSTYISAGKSCAWVIYTTSDKVLNITFEYFNFSRCNQNFLQINDGLNSAAHLIGRFCGTTLPKGGNFQSTTNNLYVWIKHDNILPKPTFKLTWDSINPVCGGDVNVTTHGSFSSPGSPGSYPSDRDCYWRFKAPFGKRILFHFFSLMIGNNKNCTQDYLEFFQGLQPTDTLLAQYCTSSQPEPLYSTGNEVLAHFHSDSQGSYPGFQISYSAVEGIPGCGGVYTLPSGEIASPTFKEGSTQNILCEYKIKLPKTNKIKLTFLSMQLESENCQFDKISVYNGGSVDSPVVGRYCGNKLPAPILIIGNEVLILFTTDIADSKKGFRLQYESLCGGEYLDETGVIESPSYPISQKIQKPITCIYEISRPYGDTIVLNITDINLGNYSSSCSNGYLEIRDGHSDNSTLIGRYCNKAPSRIVSTYNLLRIKYIVNYGTVTGFQLKYSVINNNGCGGILTSKVGSVQSPEDLSAYTSGLTCSWMMVAPEDYVIQITWVNFNVEDTYGCRFDRVSVIDNGTVPGTEVGVYCGHQLPPTLISTSNIVTVNMVVDGTNNLDGFLLTYSFIHQKNLCGGMYFTTAGTLKSPLYPDHYPINKDCVWILTVPPGQQILLNITFFDLEKYLNCRYDFLEIRNGGTSASPLIGKYCGTTIPKTIPSHTNQIYIRFKSDVTKTAGGFLINWSSTATGCGGTLTSPTGTIISPHYPKSYSKNTECYWKISVSSGSIVQVVFADLDLENHFSCILDYVELFDGAGIAKKSLGRFCTLHGVSAVYKSTSNILTVKFRSDLSMQGRGFQLQYATICNNKLTGFNGVIETPNFPYNYPHDIDCFWEIEVAEGNKINITFSHFSLEHSLNYITKNCSRDYVQVMYKDLDDEPNLLTYGTYCDKSVPKDMNIKSNFANIHYVSDSYLLGNGFRLEWAIDGCGGILIKPEGTIQTPNYPKAYPISTQCDWLIQTEFGNSIQITFHDIDLERTSSCDYDYVSFYNGLDDTFPLITKVCDQKSHPVTLTSTGNNLFVRFRSDASYRGRGFSASYKTSKSKCGGKITALKGTIHSPNYPKNFDRNDSCVWLIEVPDNHVVHLTIKDLDLLRMCSVTYLKIYDGPTEAYPVLAKLCGNKKVNKTIVSTTNYMVVEMMSNSSFVTKGFLAEYSTGCGALIKTGGSGIINYSPEYTTGIDIENCTWTIESERPDKHVFLTITYLASSYCYDNTTGINVYDGVDNTSPMIGHYCGKHIPPMIRSSGNFLHIELANIDHEFSAKYTVVDTECGGTLESGSGVFATPNYPNNYPVDIQCEWNLKSSPGNKITVRFDEFELSQSDQCNEDYLEIRAGNSSGTFLGVFCGTNQPNNITADNDLWIIFRSDKPLVGSDGSTAKGFKAEYELVHGNELYGKRGKISSPMYPRKYMDNGEFMWRITVRRGQRMAINFLDFDTDFYEDDMCYLTTLEIFDGYDTTAPLLGTFCGTTPPENIKTTSNTAYIVMNYNVVRKGSKFLLEWNEIPTGVRIFNHTIKRIDGCGSDETIFIPTNFKYNITSPGYPEQKYPEYKCEWTFATSEDQHLKLSIKNLDLIVFIPCELGDSVTIYNGANGTTEYEVVDKICRFNYTDSVFETSNLMKVVLNSYHYKPNIPKKKGLSAYVESVCGGTMTSPSGVIVIDKNVTSGYFLPFQCEWRISVRTGRKIKVEFIEFSIMPASPCKNYLMFKNGHFPDSPLLGAGKFCGNNTPNALETTGNFLYANLFSSSFATKVTFKYSEVSVSCGNDIFLSNDNNSTIINSPNYPNIPPPHSECQWRITVPGGESVRLDFLEVFDLTSETDCPSEGVELRSGGTKSSPLIGVFCDKIPSTQRSVDNMMYIRFYTNDNFPKNGFKAKVSIASCGGVLRDHVGSITSPNYFNVKAYPVNMFCEWLIVAPVGHFVKLEFETIDLPYSVNKNCSERDAVTIKEFSSFNRTEVVLGEFCDRQLPPKIKSSGNEVYVYFKTGNVSRRYNGFKINFNTSHDACGGDLETESGVIMSPGYPVMNHDHIRCKWTIRVQRGRRIKVKVEDIDFDNSVNILSQGVSFFNDEDILSRITFLNGGNTTVKYISSSENIMTIFFWGQYSPNHRGFKASYTSDEPSICIGSLDGDVGIIKSPTEKVYRCSWINTQPILNQTVAFMVDANFTKNYHHCAYGFIAFQENSVKNAPYIYKTCTKSSAKKVRSPYPLIKLDVSSGGVSNIQQMSFTIHYKKYPCGGLISSSYGSLSSPSNLENELECAWKFIGNKRDVTLSLNFVEFNLGSDCEKNYLIIYNGDGVRSPMIGKFCNDNKPTQIQTQSNSLWVEYQYTPNSGAKGFNFTYEPITSGCGGVFHSSSLIIQTPSYPKPYPNNAECLWDLRAKPGYHIKLSFLDRFQIESSNKCSNDYVQFFTNLQDRSKAETEKFCGRQAPFETRNFTSEQLFVLFRSNQVTDGIGFRMKWELVCGGTFVADKNVKYIVSPGYPNAYANNLMCVYKIVAAEDSIIINFEDFELETGIDNCNYDYLEINFERTSKPLFNNRRFCGDNKPLQIQARNFYTITFKTDGWISRRGFKFSYQSDTCGGDITKPTKISFERKRFSNQSFSNDFYGNYFRMFRKLCNWQITAPPQSRVILKFLKINMQSSFRCGGESVIVSEQGARLMVLCGQMETENMPIVHSNGTSMTVTVTSYSALMLGSSFEAAVYFTKGPEAGCGGDIFVQNTTSRVIESLHDANNDCVWKFRTSHGYTFKIEILEQKKCDSVSNGTDLHDCSCVLYQLRDGITSNSELMDTICDFNITSLRTYYTSDNLAFIRIATGYTATHTPKIRVTSIISICGTSIIRSTNTPKTLTSPNFPNTFPKNLKCTWTIKSYSYGNKIHLKFIEVDLNKDIATNATCDNKNKLVLTDHNIVPYKVNYDLINPKKPTTISTLQYAKFQSLHESFTICNNDIKDYEYYSSNDMIQVTFYSTNDGKTHKGFKLEHTIANCNRNYTSLSGRVTKNWSTQNCSIYIIVPKNYTISLYFQNVQMGYGNCQSNKFEVFEKDAGHNKLLELCRSLVANPVFSTGNQLFIRSTARLTALFFNFDMTYVATKEGRGCGGDIYDFTAVFTSPMYPDTFKNDSFCTWNVKVPAGLQVALQFLNFDVLGPCETNYVVVTTYVNDMESTRSFCRKDAPAVLISSEKMKVQYKTNNNNEGTGWRAKFLALTSDIKTNFTTNTTG